VVGVGGEVSARSLTTVIELFEEAVKFLLMLLEIGNELLEIIIGYGDRRRLG
jgi:hypothetical protein